jgi:hypothetical protein
MSAKSVFKMGFLSMIAATGLFVASNGFAAEARTTSNVEDVRAKTGMPAQAREATGDTRAVLDDVKSPETPAPRGQVVDSKGNVYFLTLLKTTDGEACGEHVHQYIPRIGA